MDKLDFLMDVGFSNYNLYIAPTLTTITTTKKYQDIFVINEETGKYEMNKDAAILADEVIQSQEFKPIKKVRIRSKNGGES